MPNIRVKQGAAELVGISENPYNVTPPPMPEGWNFSITGGKVQHIASINIDYKNKKAAIKLDDILFNDPEVPEGCKIVMLFHEMGHLIFGPDEAACDRFAFYHALRAGVSPFLCYLTIRTYMPEHYNYRIIEMFNNIEKNSNLTLDYEN